jgi:GNAT superfamily N-acetyltransferase/N-acetylglutamate synthase-like GNAT family acetyltransferase
MIEVRQSTIHDKQAIFKFLSKAYKDKARYKFPERWEWQFENNPFKKEDELPIWIAVDEKGKVVGQICTMIEPLKIGMETLSLCYWAVDLFVLPEYRDQKIGFKLSKAIYDENDNLMALPMSETFRHYMMKLGCMPLDSVAVYNRLTRFDALSTFDAFRHRLNNKWYGKILLWALRALRLDHLITALINLGVWINDLRLPRFKDTGIEIKQIDEFDETMDEFWERVSPQFQVIVRRDSQFLNWKYVHQPYMQYQIFTASRDGRICGYVILRKTRPPESNSGIIADLLVSPDDQPTINSLLTFAVQHFKQQKVKYIFAASSVEGYKSALMRQGFKRQKEVVPLFHSKVETPLMNSVFTKGAWLLGRSDHDWDQFPYT